MGSEWQGLEALSLLGPVDCWDRPSWPDLIRAVLGLWPQNLEAICGPIENQAAVSVSGVTSPLLVGPLCQNQEAFGKAPED